MSNSPPIDWKVILNKSRPTKTDIALIVKNLSIDHVLCKEFPRKGLWFNEVRRAMQITPKELRSIVVKGSKETAPIKE